jgi:hypothetical protein
VRVLPYIKDRLQAGGAIQQSPSLGSMTDLGQ